MASNNIDYDILKDALVELKEAKELIKHDCKVAAMQKIDFAMAAIKAKIENSR